MNAVQRRLWYPKIAKDQGGSYCRGCGRTVWYTENLDEGHPIGIIDHIDNKKPHINKLSNLQILCRSCNRIKNPRKPFIPPIQKTLSEKINEQAEEPFRVWIFDKVLDSGSAGFDVDHALNGGAEKFGISPETTRKYLAKLTSPEGLYDVIKGKLIWKTNEEIDEIVHNEMPPKITKV